MRRALAALALLLAPACGGPRLNVPSGPGVPIGQAVAEDAYRQAAACTAVRTLTAEVAVRGSAAGRRVRGRLSVGVAAPASVRLEAVAPFGAPAFIFAAVEDDASLLLPRDARVLQHGRAEDVLGALTGIALGAGNLAAVLTGCGPEGAGGDGISNARQFGDAWIAFDLAAHGTLYLRRDGAGEPWALAAVHQPPGAREVGWQAEYTDRRAGTPRAIRLASIDTENHVGRTFDVTLALSQVETGVSLGADVFSIVVPNGAMPITLDELRGWGAVDGR
ncbi:MAG: hypothetical protein ABUS56_12970 [Acidobacteriota bacterium]